MVAGFTSQLPWWAEGGQIQERGRVSKGSQPVFSLIARTAFTAPVWSLRAEFQFEKDEMAIGQPLAFRSDAPRPRRVARTIDRRRRPYPLHADPSPGEPSTSDPPPRPTPERGKENRRPGLHWTDKLPTERAPRGAGDARDDLRHFAGLAARGRAGDPSPGSDAPWSLAGVVRDADNADLLGRAGAGAGPGPLPGAVASAAPRVALHLSVSVDEAAARLARLVAVVPPSALPLGPGPVAARSLAALCAGDGPDAAARRCIGLRALFPPPTDLGGLLSSCPPLLLEGVADADDAPDGSTAPPGPRGAVPPWVPAALAALAEDPFPMAGRPPVGADAGAEPTPSVARLVAACPQLLDVDFAREAVDALARRAGARATGRGRRAADGRRRTTRPRLSSGERDLPRPPPPPAHPRPPPLRPQPGPRQPRGRPRRRARPREPRRLPPRRPRRVRRRPGDNRRRRVARGGPGRRPRGVPLGGARVAREAEGRGRPGPPSAGPGADRRVVVAPVPLFPVVRAAQHRQPSLRARRDGRRRIGLLPQRVTRDADGGARGGRRATGRRGSSNGPPRRRASATPPPPSLSLLLDPARGSAAGRRPRVAADAEVADGRRRPATPVSRVDRRARAGVGAGGDGAGRVHLSPSRPFSLSPLFSPLSPLPSPPSPLFSPSPLSPLTARPCPTARPSSGQPWPSAPAL